MYIIYEKYFKKPNYSGTSVDQVGRSVPSSPVYVNVP